MDRISGPELNARVNELEQQVGVNQRTETNLREALAYSESIVDTVREPMLVLDATLRIITASRAFCTTFRVLPEETTGRFVYDIGDGQWNIPALRTLLEEVLPEKKGFRDFEVVHTFPYLGTRVMLLNGNLLWSEDEAVKCIVLAIEDVTNRKSIEAELVRSNEVFSGSPTSLPTIYAPLLGPGCLCCGWSQSA